DAFDPCQSTDGIRTLYPTPEDLPREQVPISAQGSGRADSRMGADQSVMHTEDKMLYWALVFFVVAIVAAIFGFGGIAAGASSIPQVLFFLFLVVAIASLIMGTRRRR